MRTQDKTLHASAPETTTGVSGWIDVSEYLEGILFVNVSAITGTLTLTVQATNKGENVTITHSTLTAITATGAAFKLLTNFGAKIRLKWTLGTDESATFQAIFTGKRSITN